MNCFIKKESLASVIPMFRHLVIDCRSGYLILDVETYSLIARESTNILNESHMYDSILGNNASLIDNYKRLAGESSDLNLVSLYGVIGFIKQDLINIDISMNMNIILDIIRDQPINTLYKKKAQLLRKIEILPLMIDDIERYIKSATTEVDAVQRETIDRLVQEVLSEEMITRIAEKVAFKMPAPVIVSQPKQTVAITQNPDTSNIEVTPSAVAHNSEKEEPAPISVTDVSKSEEAVAPAVPLAEVSNTESLEQGELSGDAFNDLEFSFKPKKKAKPRAEPVLEQKISSVEATEENAELDALVRDFL